MRRSPGCAAIAHGVVQATEATLALAIELGARGVVGELALWRRRAGISEEIAADVAEPYAVPARRRLARRRRSSGPPSGARTKRRWRWPTATPTARRRALDQLHELGAAPGGGDRRAAPARAGRARAARAGRAATTRDNPANLTPREVEVLALVEQGLRNRQIAERLFVSAKTVDHHVGAILRKLGVHTRGEAGAAARRLGFAPDDD